MKCAVHTEMDATGFCRNCGKAMCAQCTRDVRGILYCEPCLAEMVAKPQASKGYSPGKAFWLGFIPGLGAAYNEEYSKAAIHVLIFIAFVGALNSDLGEPLEPMLGLLLTAFLFYMAFDARRTAQAKARGQAPPSPMESHSLDKPIGPIILITLGVIFLLGKHFPISNWIREFWPVIFIAVGVALLWNRMRRTS